MDSLDKIFDKFPTLVATLREGEFESIFDRRTWSRARSYASGSHIKTLRIKEDEPGMGSILAEIKGTASRPYLARISFQEFSSAMDLNPEECSCPVGYQCKHLAAVLMYLEKRAERYTAPLNTVQPILDWETEDWLKGIREEAVKNAAASAAPSNPYNKILCYCIEKNSYREDIVLNLRVGTLKKSGDVTLDRSLASADVSRPPKYLSEEDLPLVIRYRTLQRQHFDYQGLRLQGKGCGAFLTDLFATGRLFIVMDIGSRQTMFSVKAEEMGVEEAVSAVWQQLEGDRTRPALEFSREGISFTPTDPPFYVDFATGDFGALKSDLPGSLLKKWKSGPVIGSASAPTIGEVLRKIPGKPIPLPVKLDEKQMPASKPEAVLRIWRTEIGGDPIILANPLFRYGESALLPPADSAELLTTHAEIRENTRLVWQRDPTTETKLVKRLWKNGFEPLAAFTPAHLLSGETHHSLLRVDTDYNDVVAWFDFLDGDEVKALEKAGWKIEIDPDSGLTLREVTEFFPEIESDADHGIDWFRFDVSGEANGKRFSLIPHIAAAIADGILETSPHSPHAENPRGGHGR